MGKRKIYIDEEKRLAIEVRKFVCLYDRTCIDYKNRRVRLNAWEKIEDELGWEEGQGEIRFENLKKRYRIRRVAVKKCQYKGCEGTRELEMAEDALRKYSFLKWLDPYLMGTDPLSNAQLYVPLDNSASKTLTTTEIQRNVHKTPENLWESESEDEDFERNKIDEEETFEVTDVLPTMSVEIPERKKRKESSDEPLVPTNKAPQVTNRNNMSKEDNDDLFGKIIANELRALPKLKKAQMKHEINNVIFKYQCDEYEYLLTHRPTKFLDDDWMAERDFIKHDISPGEEEWWWHHKVSSLDLSTPLTIVPTMKCQAAIDIMNKETFDQLPVVNEGGYVEGMVTLGNLMGKMVSGKITPDSPVSECTYDQFKKVSLTTSLYELSRVLDRDYFALVVHSQKLYSDINQSSEKQIIFGIVTRMDLLNYITKNHPDTIKDKESDGMATEMKKPPSGCPAHKSDN